MSAIEVRTLTGDAELARLSEIEGWSFGLPTADSSGWLTRGGLDQVRVAVQGTSVVGGLLLVPMGQWFGGRSVPMTGIAGVGVAAEARGRGVARALMAATVRELAERGVALSTLYPATLPLYRSAGYELAGCRFQVEVPLGRLGVAERELEVREIRDSDFERIRAVYTARARHENGHLDRGDYVWNRVRAPRAEPARGWLVERGGEPEGYVYLRQKSAGLAYDLALTDLVAVSRGALRRLLAFLGDHHSLGERVIWHASPADPFVTELPERGAEIELSHHWMLRVVCPTTALEARGYPQGASAGLDLEVVDELLGSRQRLRLDVSGGVGKVTPGGSGALGLDVRGLASLYSGFASPFALALSGLAEGDDAVLARAASVFALPMPTMPDMF